MKTALVTGAGKRLGREIALALGEEGYALYLHCNRSRAETESLAAELGRKGTKSSIVTADLADAWQVEDLLGQCVALGPVTLLVNNAAVYEPDNIHDFTAEEFDKQMAVNLRAPMLLSQAFAVQMPAGEKGLIVNFLDHRIKDPPNSFMTYSLSKVGLAAATRMLARSLAPQIRVCGIAPGLTLPVEDMPESQYEELRATTLLGHGVDPSDIIGALRYLLTVGSVTGQILYVDSGQNLLGPKPEKRCPTTPIPK